jgi:hypothetical protein
MIHSFENPFMNCIGSLYVILITMKAMNSVTAVEEMEEGGQPLWNTLHWMCTRNTPGHE